MKARQSSGEQSVTGAAHRKPATDTGEAARSVASSPFIKAQREQFDGMFGPTVQRKNETGLPDNLKAGVENLSGMSLDSVQVHYNSPQPAQMNALAYAQGSDIHVAPGQEQHVPHEAWHVVQQAQGRVRPTMQAGGVPVNDSSSLEREADRMGGAARRYRE